MRDSARAYHEATAYDRRQMTGHSLDWGNQPEAFKTYPSFESVPLPKEPHLPRCSLWDLAGEAWEPDPDIEIDMNGLAGILLMSHAVTAKARHGGTFFHYRSVASAGALYPFETYVAAFDVPGLDDGLYHHDIAGQNLELLRTGNALAELSPAVGVDMNPAPVLMFVLTAIFFRSSWKYRDRAYRYALLDTGHLVENLALAIRSERARFTLCRDFDDAAVNRILGLDTAREVSLAVVPVWGKPSGKGAGVGLSDPHTDLARFSRVASREIDYPLIGQAHAATSAVKTGPRAHIEMSGLLGPDLGEERPFSRPATMPGLITYPEAVLRRRSMRNFVPTEMSADHLSALLFMLCAKPLNSAVSEPGADNAVCVGFLAGNVEGLDPGFYMVHRERQTICAAARGSMMDAMTHICLDQAWLANCAVHFLFLGNLDAVESSYGPRGYRHAMMTAGRLGQRLYLSATSMKLGCCGIGAYYDDEAARLLGLNAESKLLYLTAVGPIKKYHG